MKYKSAGPVSAPFDDASPRHLPRRVRESSSRASMEPSESYQTTVDADTFHPRAPDPNDAAKV